MLKLVTCQRSVAPLKRVGLLLAAALAAAGAGTASAQPVADESVIKAAFVYNFAKYTEWPEPLWNQSANLRLCTVGERGTFSAAVANLAAKPPVHGKAIEVRAVARPADVSNCHILVLAGQERMTEWTRAVRLLPVLTIGESEGFAAAGGVIGLFAEGEKIKFEINREAAQRAGLKLSSQLLKLARLVKEESGADK